MATFRVTVLLLALQALLDTGRGGGGDLNTEYYRAAKQPKTIWRLPESGHVAGSAPVAVNANGA